MSTSYGHKIVTRGLLVCLDAANEKSNNAGASDWFDLSYPGAQLSASNPRNCEWVTAPTFNSAGYWTFNGTSHYGTITPALSMTNFTIEVWARPNGNQTTSSAIISDYYPAYVNYALTFQANNLDVYAGIYTPVVSWKYSGAKTLANGAWHQIVMTHDGTNINLYVNKSAATSGVLGQVAQSSAVQINIGKRWDIADYYKGDLAAIFMYDRALSVSEIGQNYNALSQRFGL